MDSGSVFRLSCWVKQRWIIFSSLFYHDKISCHYNSGFYFRNTKLEILLSVEFMQLSTSAIGTSPSKATPYLYNSKAYGILFGTIGWHKLHCIRFLPEGNQKMDRKSQTNCEMAENSGNPRPLKRQHYCLHTELRGWKRCWYERQVPLREQEILKAIRLQPDQWQSSDYRNCLRKQAIRSIKQCRIRYFFRF